MKPSANAFCSLIGLLSVLILIGCAPAAPVLIPPSPFVAAQLDATAGGTETQSLSKTLDGPGSAIAPEFTQTPEAAITATLTPIPTDPQPTPTPDARATEIVEEIIATVQPITLSTFPSPDKQWQVEVVRYDCAEVVAGEMHAFEQLKLIRLENGTEQTIDTQLQYCGGLGAAGLGGLAWSHNSRYFYYTEAREGVPDGACSYWQPSMNRVDVLAPDVERVGSGYLSPDNTRLAMWQNHELAIWSLDEGKIGQIPALVPDALPADIAWAPDSSAFVYLETTGVCLPFGQSYLVQVDLSNLEQALLLESETPGFGLASWTEPDLLELTDDEFNQWKYDLITKELWRAP